MHPTCDLCGSALADAAPPPAPAHLPVTPPPAADPREIELRGHLYQELDLLAFTLEMEAAEALERGEPAAAERAQQTRLGIRLAQRLVGAVSAPEVDRRLQRWRPVYQAKIPG